MSRLGLWDKVVAVVGKVEDVAPLLASGTFGLVWIDGAHDAESVARDTALALRVLSPGGTIAWHDWDYESVRAGASPAALWHNGPARMKFDSSPEPESQPGKEGKGT